MDRQMDRQVKSAHFKSVNWHYRRLYEMVYTFCGAYESSVFIDD